MRPSAYWSIIHKNGFNPSVLSFQPQLGDIYLYAALEFSGIAVPDVMSLTDWVKNFKTAFEAEERIKNYIANRPQYLIPY